MKEMIESTKPCVGCGYCCKKAWCSYAQIEHGHLEPLPDVCPALIWDDIAKRYLCQKVLRPGGDIFAEALAIGEGCCSPLNTERRKYRNES